MVTQMEFDFFDAIDMMIDIHSDRNVTIDFNNELITIEASQCQGCNSEPVVDQNNKIVTHIGKNIGWVL